MKPLPTGWPRIIPTVYYQDTTAMVSWLQHAFGFTLRFAVDPVDGQTPHAELTYGDGLIMIGRSTGASAGSHQVPQASPLVFSRANTQTIQVYVDDAKAHCEAARKAGATIVNEPFLADHGEAYWADMSYGALDPESHLWWFTERVRG